jgi:hypothetical protein
MNVESTVTSVDGIGGFSNRQTSGAHKDIPIVQLGFIQRTNFRSLVAERLLEQRPALRKRGEDRCLLRNPGASWPRHHERV